MQTTIFPSISEQALFEDWLEFILLTPENAPAWSARILATQDWSASQVVEVPSNATKSGNAEIYSFNPSKSEA